MIPSHIYTEHKQVHHTQLSDPSFLRSRWQKECSACMSVSACHLLPKKFQYIYYLRTCKRSISPKKLQLLCDFSSPNQTDCPGDCSAPARSACPEERNREECKACTASTRVKLKHSVTRWCRQDGDGLPCPRRQDQRPAASAAAAPPAAVLRRQTRRRRTCTP